MLNHLLAGVVGLGGLSLFLSGFFFPEVRRQPDFAWSGVALLYALVLWIEGDSTPGGALFGHIASVALILWFGWQTLQQRQQFAAPEEKTSIPNSLETLTPFLKAGWGRMTTAYGEAADWLQTQLGKGDTESLTSQSPQGETLEEAWDDDRSAVSTSSSVSTVTAVTSEHPETDLIAPAEAETPKAEDLQPNPAQLQPEASPDAPPQVIPDSPVGKEDSPPSAAIDSSAALASEISHDIPVEEKTATQSKSGSLEEDQSIPNEETMHEDVVHNSTREYDDGSWPPEDSVT